MAPAAPDGETNDFRKNIKDNLEAVTLNRGIFIKKGDVAGVIKIKSENGTREIPLYAVGRTNLMGREALVAATGGSSDNGDVTMLAYNAFDLRTGLALKGMLKIVGTSDKGRFETLANSTTQIVR